MKSHNVAQAPDGIIPAGRFAVWLERTFASRWSQFALFLVFALTLRVSIFGDWAYEVDPQFYMLAGQRMLDGALLYVDVWDRKPPGLFLLYAGMAAISRSPVLVYVMATICVALAAYGVNRIARMVAGPQGALLAGLTYCVMVDIFGGAGGQSPVFYNPLMVVCAWTIATSLEALKRGERPMRLILGMACAGIAITIKQSVAVEAAVLGLMVVWLAWHGGMPLKRLLPWSAILALVGALPMLLCIAYYLAINQFPAMWQALVLSNTNRLYDTAWGMLVRYLTLFGLLGPSILFAGMSIWAKRKADELNGVYGFAIAWLGAALLAIVIYPGLFTHYPLTLLAPICIVGAPFFDRRDLGLPTFVLLAIAMVVKSGTLDFAERNHSRAVSAEMAEYVARQSPQGRIMVWGFPLYLYALRPSTPPTPLLFPPHLYDGAEERSSGLDTRVETARVLAWNPEAVIVQEPIIAWPINEATNAQVRTWIRRCATKRVFIAPYSLGRLRQVVYSDCAKPSTNVASPPTTGTIPQSR